MANNVYPEGTATPKAGDETKNASLNRAGVGPSSRKRARRTEAVNVRQRGTFKDCQIYHRFCGGQFKTSEYENLICKKCDYRVAKSSRTGTSMYEREEHLFHGSNMEYLRWYAEFTNPRQEYCSNGCGSIAMWDDMLEEYAACCKSCYEKEMRQLPTTINCELCGTWEPSEAPVHIRCTSCDPVWLFMLRSGFNDHRHSLVSLAHSLFFTPDGAAGPLGRSKHRPSAAFLSEFCVFQSASPPPRRPSTGRIEEVPTCTIYPQGDIVLGSEMTNEDYLLCAAYEKRLQIRDGQKLCTSISARRIHPELDALTKTNHGFNPVQPEPGRETSAIKASRSVTSTSVPSTTTGKPPQFDLNAGYCYLAYFPKAQWPEVAAKYGKNPRASRLPRRVQRELRVGRRGAIVHACHDDGTPLANGYTNHAWYARVGHRSPLIPLVSSHYGIPADDLLSAEPAMLQYLFDTASVHSSIPNPRTGVRSPVLSRQDKVDAWMGDATHHLDTRGRIIGYWSDHVDQALEQSFTSNVAQRTYLETHRPDVVSYWQLLSQPFNTHHWGSVFEYEYHNDITFRDYYWSRMTASPREGYCYLSFIRSDLQGVIVSEHGAYPLLSQIAPWLSDQARFSLRSNLYHACQEGPLTISDITTNLPVGRREYGEILYPRRTGTPPTEESDLALRDNCAFTSTWKQPPISPLLTEEDITAHGMPLDDTLRVSQYRPARRPMTPVRNEPKPHKPPTTAFPRTEPMSMPVKPNTWKGKVSHGYRMVREKARGLKPRASLLGCGAAAPRRTPISLTPRFTAPLKPEDPNFQFDLKCRQASLRCAPPSSWTQFMSRVKTVSDSSMRQAKTKLREAKDYITTVNRQCQERFTGIAAARRKGHGEITPSLSSRIANAKTAFAAGANPKRLAAEFTGILTYPGSFLWKLRRAASQFREESKAVKQQACDAAKAVCNRIIHPNRYAGLAIDPLPDDEPNPLDKTTLHGWSVPSPQYEPPVSMTSVESTFATALCTRLTKVGKRVRRFFSVDDAPYIDFEFMRSDDVAPSTPVDGTSLFRDPGAITRPFIRELSTFTGFMWYAAHRDAASPWNANRRPCVRPLPVPSDIIPSLMFMWDMPPLHMQFSLPRSDWADDVDEVIPTPATPFAEMLAHEPFHVEALFDALRPLAPMRLNTENWELLIGPCLSVRRQIIQETTITHTMAPSFWSRCSQWVRDLTSDGDVESHPGPILSRIADDLQLRYLDYCESSGLVDALRTLRKIATHIGEIAHAVGDYGRAHAIALCDVPLLRAELIHARINQLLMIVAKAYSMPTLRTKAEFLHHHLLAASESIGQRTRRKSKPAWAFMIKPFVNKTPLSRCRIRMPVTGKQRFVWTPAEDALMWHARLIADAVGEEVKTVRHRMDIVRTFNRNPYIDNHLAAMKDKSPYFDFPDSFDRMAFDEKQAYALAAKFKSPAVTKDVPDGIDNVMFADARNVDASLARYAERFEAHGLFDPKEVADVIFWRNPELYAHQNLLSGTRKIIKNLKSSPGIGFEQGVSKAKLKRLHLLDPLIYAGINTVTFDELYPTVSHVFPKSQVVKRNKIDPAWGGDPKKIRTILGIPVMVQARERFLHGDMNDRRDPWSAPGKPGMPMTGRAFNKLYVEAAHWKFHYSLDGTAFDASVMKEAVRVVYEIRKKGFDWHPDRDEIHRALDANYEDQVHSWLMNLVADPADPLRWREKHGGMKTGDASVTENNTVTLFACMLIVLARTWNMPYKEVLENMALENVGDDNFLHTNREIDKDSFIREAKLTTGVDFRFEGAGTDVTGVEFLSKTGYAMTPDEVREMELLGIDMTGIKYKVLHNRDTLLMRYLNLKQDAFHVKKAKDPRPLIRISYMLERIIGYASLCAHQPDVYAFLAAEYEFYLNSIRNEKIAAIIRSRKALKLPDYRKVMHQWYAALPADGSKKGLTTRLTAILDAANITAYNMDRNVRSIMRTVNAIDPEFWDLPDFEIYSLPSIPRGWKPTYQVEHFIFWRHAERLLERDPDVTPMIEMSDMVALARQSPFFGTTDIQGFCLGFMPRCQQQIFDADDPVTLVREQAIKWRFRMTLLSLLYAGISTASSVLPAGFLALPMLLMDLYYAGLRRLFSWLSYAYWLDKGTGNATISNLVPKDQYGPYKMLAAHVLSMIPMSVTLPDLLPFLQLDTGGALEMIAKAVNFITGFATSNQDDSREHATSEQTLSSDTWDTVTTQLYLQLRESPGRAIVLDAPTGSGKTYHFPPTSVRNRHSALSGVYVRYHFILVPTRILWTETTLKTGMKCNKTHPFPVDREGVFLMTYGYAQAIWSTICDVLNTYHPDNVVFQFDEFHFQSPEQLWIDHHVKAEGFYRVISTATPRLALTKEVFPTYVAPIPRKHQIRQFVLDGHNPIDVFHDVMTSRNAQEQGVTHRILIIEPSERQCDIIVNSIRQRAITYGPGFSINKVSSSSRTVPPEGHIVITQMGRAGVTIKGISCVISSGREIVSHYGTVQAGPSSVSARIQEAGRTGRDRDGVYFCCQPQVNHNDPVTVAGPLASLRDLDIYNAAGEYHFTTNIASTRRIHNAHFAMTTLFHVFRTERQMSMVQRRSMEIWLQCQDIYHTDDDQTCTNRTAIAYNSVIRHHPTEDVEHLRAHPAETYLTADQCKRFFDEEVYVMIEGTQVKGRLCFQGSFITVGQFLPQYLPFFPMPRRFRDRRANDSVKINNLLVLSFDPRILVELPFFDVPEEEWTALQTNNAL